MRLSEAQIAEFDQQGFLFFPSLLSPAEVAVLREPLPELLFRSGPEVVSEEADASRPKLVFGVHSFDETFRRLTLHPALLIPSEQLLGSGVCVYQARLNPKAGFSGGGWGWHQDFNQWHRLDGMQQPRALMVAVFLDDVNACNAPLMVIPGSHRRGHIPIPDAMEIDLETVREMAEAGGVEALIGPAGSVGFLSCLLVHGSTGNLSPWSRCLFYVNYNSTENRELTRPRDPYRCGTDFTPLRPLAADCLLRPEPAPATPPAPPSGA
jgi:ectoine hydroxylase